MKQMKDIYTTTTSHRSIRKYKPDMIPNDELKMMLQAAIHAPSSVNGQQWSVIVIKDAKTKDKIASLTQISDLGRQEWIAQCPVFLLFVMDYYKLAKELKKQGRPFGHIDSIEATMVGCVDIGIAFSNAMNVAESLGYGTVPIGAVRGKPREIIELLKLPKGTYPILGMCVGIPDQNPAMKPRIPFDATVHKERYNTNTDDLIAEYDKAMKVYMDKRSNGKDIRSWTQTTGSYYKEGYYPFEKEVLKEQGFPNKF